MNEMEFKQQYERAIPASCALRTFEQHADELLLCWGVSRAIEHGTDVKCGICPMATRTTSGNDTPASA